MEIKEIRQKSENELASLLAESQDKLRQFKFDLAVKKLKNPKEIKETKKIIARIKTILNTNKKNIINENEK